MLQLLMRSRGRRKARWIAPSVVGRSILDLGAGEGYVGEALQQELHCEVTLVDVIDVHRVSLPFRLYDGRRLPFASESFDTVIASLVLHHCEDPLQVLREAARVCRSRVVVSESICFGQRDRSLLHFLDACANWIRSGGKIAAPLHFKTEAEWLGHFHDTGLAVVERRWLTRFIHHQMLFVLDVPQNTSQDQHRH